MEDFYNHIKTWHMLVNKKLDDAIESDYPVTLKGPSEEEEVIEITDPEALILYFYSFVLYLVLLFISR